MTVLHALLPLTMWLLQVAVHAQIAWTPIYVDGNSQVDLWTQDSQGCTCDFDSGRNDCACCVKEGGCQCGSHMPNRCSQCGLEQHCGKMCNVTLDARFLAARSGKTFGQIKSPSLEGPAFCWFLLQPDAGQRVEVQVYRLVSAGRFNGSSCEGGFLQLVEGPKPVPVNSEVQICGGNERFSPPVVLFSDKGPASLLFVINERTYRSQFLAYYSFTWSLSTGDVSSQMRGGHRLENTECDWMYQEYLCRTSRYCVITSPGYPGLYPPNRHCKYHIATSSSHTMVHINFTSILLPYTHCQTHHIAIFQGFPPHSTLLNTICGNKKLLVTYSGPELLVEFSSGSAIPPYDYNGFMATLEFIELTTSTEPTTSGPSTEKNTVPPQLMDGTGAPRQLIARVRCDQTFYGNITRSGHFDTKSRPWSPHCILKFVGRASDIVHLSLFNYELRAASCETALEVHDGEVNEKPRHQLCSPLTRYAKDPEGRFLGQQTFVSADNTLTLILKRPETPVTQGEEYVNGAFLFHDEKMDGTLRPETLCDVDYYGSSSPRSGRVSNPGNHQLYWNLEGTFRCLQRFVPAVNQSIMLTIVSLTGLFTDTNCYTSCGDNGCQCITKRISLEEVDYISFITDEGRTVSCICGDFQREKLPVQLRSWSSLRLVYSVANYSWMQGFSYTAEYSFITDGVCGYSVETQPTGIINSQVINTTSLKLNQYYHQECVWLFDSRAQRQLTIDFLTTQESLCSAWNITIYKYDENTIDNFGEVLDRFCPVDHQKELALPWNLNIVILRLHAVTSSYPEYTIRWKSQLERTNTKVAGPTILSSSSKKCFFEVSCVLAIIAVYHL